MKRQKLIYEQHKDEYKIYGNPIKGREMTKFSGRLVRRPDGWAYQTPVLGIGSLGPGFLSDVVKKIQELNKRDEL